jgi:hypothetical protein
MAANSVQNVVHVNNYKHGDGAKSGVIADKLDVVGNCTSGNCAEWITKYYN